MWSGPSLITVRSADSPLTLQLTKVELGHARIEVELVDALTQKPLAPVVAYMVRQSDQPMANGRSLKVARELGILRAEGLSAGTWSFTVETAEGARGKREIVVAPTDLDLRLRWEIGRPGRIVGQVVFDDVPTDQQPRRGFIVNLPFNEGQWVPSAGQVPQNMTRGCASVSAADNWVFRYEDVAALQPIVLELEADPFIARSEVSVPAGGETQVVIHAKLGGTLRFEYEGERRIEDFDLALQCAGDSTLRESNHWQPTDDKGVMREVNVPAGHVHWRIRYWSAGSTGNAKLVILEGDADVASGGTTRVGVRTL